MMGKEIEIIEGDIIPEELRREVPDSDPRNVRELGFDKLTPAERSEMARRGHEAARRNRRARQLANLEVYTSEHREMAARILGSKITVLDGLQAEMEERDKNGNIVLNTSLLSDSRLKIYLGLLETLETRGFGGPVTKTESKNETTIDVKAVIASINRDLGRTDD